jgi:hypothetical protein
MNGHIIRHNEFVVNILEGAISGKTSVGRTRLQLYFNEWLAAIPDGKLATNQKIEG